MLVRRHANKVLTAALQTAPLLINPHQKHDIVREKLDANKTNGVE